VNLSSTNGGHYMQPSEEDLQSARALMNSYPCADQVEQEDGIARDYLIKILELERRFHAEILATEDPVDRKCRYGALYNEVHRLKTVGMTREAPSELPSQTRLVLTFRRELEDRSVLDVGCGTGVFLREVARRLRHGELWGLDASIVHLPDRSDSIHFVESDIVSFRLDRQFQIVFSHQVLEHIAPADLREHISSIHSALVSGGKFIVCLPNRYWGPQDVTRIVDNSFQGETPAQGSHLNESSYCELVPYLSEFGFKNVRTLLPFGAFLPVLRSLRIRPWLNQFIERHGELRALLNLARMHGKPVFKNPIMLVCEK
jgi:SAM-dependent methyltransferase